MRRDLRLALEWFDSVDDEEVLDGQMEEAYYCPYTNAAECALLAKGWQPQELCLALECEQMKLINRSAAKRNRAA